MEKILAKMEKVRMEKFVAKMEKSLVLVLLATAGSWAQWCSCSSTSLSHHACPPATSAAGAVAILIHFCHLL
jgi:hypothetical protein